MRNRLTIKIRGNKNNKTEQKHQTMSHRGGGGAKSQGSKTEKKGEGEKRERESSLNILFGHHLVL